MATPPLSPHVPIVDTESKPTPTFLRWWQSQRDVNGDIPITAADVSATLDKIGGTQGDLLYRDSSKWNVLPAGIAGRFLQTGGAGANPAWATGASTFIGLSDTPSAYTGQAGKVAAVNGTEDGIEFVTVGGGGGGSTPLLRHPHSGLAYGTGSAAGVPVVFGMAAPAYDATPVNGIYFPIQTPGTGRTATPVIYAGGAATAFSTFTGATLAASGPAVPITATATFYMPLSAPFIPTPGVMYFVGAIVANGSGAFSPVLTVVGARQWFNGTFYATPPATLPAMTAATGTNTPFWTD